MTNKPDKPRCCICRSTAVDSIYTLSQYPICGGPVVAPEIAARIPRDDIVLGFCHTCGSCSLIQPSPVELAARLYDETYTSSNLSVAMGAPSDSKRERYLMLIDDLALPKGSSAMEIGCYDGSLLNDLRQDGFSVTGCEPSPAAKIAQEKYGLLIHNDYFSSKLFDPQKFDLVLIRNVLEHIPDPVEFLVEVGRTLKPGGAVVIAVPDGQVRIAEAILGSFVPEHPNYFGDDSLTSVLEAAGFERVMTESHKGLLTATALLPGQIDGTLPRNIAIPDTRTVALMKSTYEQGIHRSRATYRMVAEALLVAEADAKAVVLFGANTHALELLTTGAVDPERVLCAIDDGPLKWGRHLVSFDIPVSPRGQLRELDDYVLVICSYYSHDDIIHSVLKEGATPTFILRSYPQVELVPGAGNFA